ncbi:TetR-like C-terminal domain-containing protein [Pseudonocardia sp. TRM90224]|uniref:TetR-like C-terminal domain-containing protein n=1 Tax=Pseudonocardia sp. TRM90224 TaxID=2812678 RepID=UPI001E4DD455|nr:TetR-like C-terminal domain-containing protein [Pseudonocardia sp. TRM90224]
MREVAGAAIPLADSGSVDEDLRVLAIEIVKFFSGTSGAMVLALVAESVHNPDTAAGMREFWAERNERAAIAVRRGIDRGELPSEVDPVEVIRALGAPLYYRMLVTHEPLDDVVAARAAAAALAAARAGTLSRSD